MREPFEKLLFNHPLLKQVLQRWEQIGLPDAWLVAGSVAQTVWNDRHGFDLEFGLKDIDLIYFERDDLSEKREKERLGAIEDLFADLQVEFDVKNQARVHLWYEEKFGYSIPPYLSPKQAIERFPTTATSIGVRPKGEGLEIYAPYGLEDLWALKVGPNKALVSEAVYRQKIKRWQGLWPELECRAW